MNVCDFWNGQNLPPIGCYVGYRVASTDALQFDVVSEYKVAPHLDGDDSYHRVFIHFRNGNCRLLKDVLSMTNLLSKEPES
jgi:hypothetical protein